jgi:protein dithiol oxidoreductase (disulfide-forming)
MRRARRPVALLALLVLAACGHQAPPPAPAAPPATPPASQLAPPPVQTPPQSGQSETEQATASQESGDGSSERSAADNSLEQIAPAPAPAAASAGRWQAGTNYTVLVPAQPTSVPAGHVEVLEVYWLGCPHCYALEPALHDWLKNKPAWVDFVRVPVMWEPLHRSHARLYYTLEALGRPDLIAKAFDAIQQGTPLGADDEQQALRLQQKWAADNGVTAADYAKAYGSFAVAAGLSHAEEVTQRYQVLSVPTIVINGKYRTGLRQAGGDTQLMQLVADLAAAEHNH